MSCKKTMDYSEDCVCLLNVSDEIVRKAEEAQGLRSKPAKRRGKKAATRE